MPTGYTAAIQDGIEFNQFVMKCARAFGALIEMRDLPADAPIPDAFQVSDYHQQKLAQSRDELKALQCMTHEQCAASAQREYDNAVASHLETIEQKNVTRKKYQDMLDKVREWVPPSNEHIGIKNFMIEQITGSIEWDCSLAHYHPPVLLSGNEWHAQEADRIQHSIEYHTEEHAKEVQRVNGRNEWIRLLRESLRP